MSNPFNKFRSFFDCPANCPERKPACQAHCERYLKKKEQWDALKAAERERKECDSHTIECILKNRDQAAKKAKKHVH